MVTLVAPGWRSADAHTWCRPAAGSLIRRSRLPAPGRCFSTGVDGSVDGMRFREAFRQVDDGEVLWKACAEVLREQVSEAVWLTSFNEVEPVAFDGELLTLAVPSSVVRDRIEARYLTVVKGALADAGAPDTDIELRIRTDVAEIDESDWLDGLSTAADDAPLHAGAPAAASARIDTELAPGGDVANSIPANPRYTFDAFVTGTSNRFAHAAALAVAETPARSYNPLFIYGSSGLGKTHLLQGIAHYVNEHYPSFVVRYVSTEHFLNQYVDAIRTGGMPEFKRRYREVDVLLLDDIQIIEGKEGLQEELFHTFNTLHQANRQIVLSSDRPPDAISTLEDRLRGRFRMGLITEINPPDLETRLAILRKKAEGEPTAMPDDVLEFIASGITNNIRELEGALIRVSAYASLTGETLSRDMAERVLADLLNDRQPRPITPALILEKTSEMFGFTIDEIQGKSRRRPLVTARQISMYVFRNLTDLSYPAIAREFGGRDHTTVIHAVEKIGALMKERRQIYDQVTELTQSVRSGG
jgi:chromosomal replication initiator protein